jgi:hypothetical protein
VGCKQEKTNNKVLLYWNVYPQSCSTTSPPLGSFTQNYFFDSATCMEQKVIRQTPLHRKKKKKMLQCPNEKMGPSGGRHHPPLKSKRKTNYAKYMFQNAGYAMHRGTPQYSKEKKTP